MLEIGLPLGMRFFVDNLTVNAKVFNERKLGKVEKEDEEKPCLFDKKKEKTILNNKCFLFYGPKGTGKNMMVKILAHETNSFLFSKINGFPNKSSRLRFDEYLFRGKKSNHTDYVHSLQTRQKLPTFHHFSKRHRKLVGKTGL